MMPLWFARLIVRLSREPAPEPVVGTCPGFLWDVHAKRWVPVDSAMKCRHDAYSEFGPVYVSTGLQP